MGRRNRPRNRPQADKRLRLVGIRRGQVDQRKLGRVLLRVAAVESGLDSARPASSNQDGPSGSGLRVVKPASVAGGDDGSA